MTESLLIQMSSSSNAATVCNMFLFRLFVRIFCYYCPCLSLSPCSSTQLVQVAPTPSLVLGSSRLVPPLVITSVVI